jgi:dienelactone hydrolase
MVVNTQDLASLQTALSQDTIDAFGIHAIQRQTPPKFRSISSEEFPSYTRRKVAYTTQLGITIPAYLLEPHSRPPWPAVLVVHGCGYGKAGPAGVIDDYHHSIGSELAAAGFLVLIPERRGFGELQTAPRFVTPSCGAFPKDGRLDLERNSLGTLGLPLRALQVFDLMVAVDWLSSNPDVISIGAAGISGGGVVLSYLAAMDRRIEAVVMASAMSIPRALIPREHPRSPRSPRLPIRFTNIFALLETPGRNSSHRWQTT